MNKVQQLQSAESAAAVIGHEAQQQVEKLEAAVEEGKQREGQMVQKKTVSSLLHHTSYRILLYIWSGIV